MTTGRTFVDFAALKERVSLHQGMQMLGLTLKQSGAQYRGACPVHGGGDRTLVVTPGKGFYCFAEKKGGDVIQLVAHVKQIANREAAEEIDRHFGISLTTPKPQSPSERPPAPQAREQRQGFDPAAYAARLDPSADALQALGLAPETYKAFSAGYASGGVNRGKLALPLHDRAGTCIAYFGRTLKDESPKLTFPNGVDPMAHIFNAHRIQAGELYLVRDPLQVLSAYEAGIENVVAFLTDTIAPLQLEQLAALMDERKCESVELY